MRGIDLFNLDGLKAAPSQVCGSFRLVPLIRQAACNDVRIQVEKYKQDLTRVKLDDKTEYWSFIPHGFVLDWGDGKPSSITLGGQLKKDTVKLGDWFTVHNLHRMVKRRSSHSIRMLPLHLSMEYFLGLCFGGPKIVWPEYSRFAKQYGLGVRIERAMSGRSLYLFDEAIRTFEINEGQVGVLVYTAEELASAFVVPTPQDYRAVHRTLLEDFYGELIYQYAVWYSTQDLKSNFALEGAASVADLRGALYAARDHWAQASTKMMANQLIDRTLVTNTIYKPGQLVLERFMTELDLNCVNTIGERLVRSNGEVLYLKTFRLGADQSKRAWWLRQLSKHDWHLQTVATDLNMNLQEVIGGLNRCGFGYLLNSAVLKEALKKPHS